MPTGVPVNEVGTAATKPNTNALENAMPQRSFLNRRCNHNVGRNTDKKPNGTVIHQVTTAQSATFHTLSTRTNNPAASG